ncbi:RHO1 GDP-GTP exchange protein 2 [Mortierella sp. NVP85]|nr:RHO1 GDP-GTP exchange protein 2 [Mortierella sp. NVP85]
MASYTAPPSSSQGNRVNPLTPVTYTPQSSYVPSPTKKDRNKTHQYPNLNNSPYRHHSNASNVSTNSSVMEDSGPLSAVSFNGQYPLPSPKHPSQTEYQHHYHAQQVYGGGIARQSTEQLSTTGYGHNGSVYEPVSQRQLAQQPIYHPSMAKLSQVEEEGALPRPSFQRNPEDFYNDMQQDVSSLNISSPPRTRQHENSPVHPQYQGTSTGSTMTTWSQPSSPGFPPTAYAGRRLHESFDSNEPITSETALQLIDFHPGILSTIAVAFREKMLQNEAKRSDSVNYALEFPVSFTGKEAVDTIVGLVKQEDRRHAMAIARSLERQNLFMGGDVNGLTDSNNELYFFTEATLAYNPGRTEFPTVPVGVFPQSSPCYTYDCQPGGAPCYSYSCPNRQSIASDLERHNSDISTVSSQEKVWANSVPASIVAAASKKERNRQEAIFEVIQTEHNYVRDLELMEEIFINPLLIGEIVDDGKKLDMIESIFLNFREIIELNKRMLADLRERQQQQPLVESIGDILLAHIAGFETAYMKYIQRIALSEYTYKKEEAQNPRFAQFLKDCTRHPEARRLGLRHFVGQPYQRIPRYPLLLQEVVKRTDEGVRDRETVLEVINMCKELGKRIDARIPEGQRQLRLLIIQDKIIWKIGDAPQDLKLSDKSRKLHFECIVKRRSNLDVQMIELRLFLFDQVLLMTKEKRSRQIEKDDKESTHYQVSKNPIPLELMHVYPDDGRSMSIMNVREAVPGKKLNNSTKSTTSSHRQSTFVAHDNAPIANHRVGFQDSKYTAPVTIEHLGRRGGNYTIYMTASDREQFLEQVEIAKARRQEAVSGLKLFKTTEITHFNAAQPIPLPNLVYHPMDGRRVTCSAPYLNVLDGRKRVVVGTEEGVFVGMEDDPNSFTQAIQEPNVSQVSVLENYHILLVLAGKVLKAFNLSVLDPHAHAEKSLKIGQQLGKSVQYFTAGVCAGKTLVITMKRKNAGESHFSAYEPVENAVLGGHHHTKFLSFGKSNKSEWFKLYREFYVGSDSSQLLMLAKMVCVVCPNKGFEIIMLDNLGNTQVFPERKHPSFAFLEQRPGSEPISMFKISSDMFLMCYSDFAFKMTKNGSLAQQELIEWEGRPESFAVAYPYIMAFENTFIEIRNIETGVLEQIILGNNIRRLYSNMDPNGNAIIQLVMQSPESPEVRQIVKLIKAPPPPKTQLEPIEYQPRAVYVPTPKQKQNASSTPAHLMAAALQPVLSTNGSGPAVLASHTHQSPGSPHYPSLPQSPQLQNFHTQVNHDGTPRSPYQQHHPYSPATQGYPQVFVPPDSNGTTNGAGGNQDQQQQQQHHHKGSHSISWSSGGYP